MTTIKIQNSVNDEDPIYDESDDYSDRPSLTPNVISYNSPLLKSSLQIFRQNLEYDQDKFTIPQPKSFHEHIYQNRSYLDNSWMEYQLSRLHQ